MKNSSSFKPGTARPPHSGRKKGTPNKKTAELREIVDEKLGAPPISKMCDRFLEAEKLGEHERADMWLDRIAKFYHPMPKALVLSGDTENPVAVAQASVTPEQLANWMKAAKAERGK